MRAAERARVLRKVLEVREVQRQASELALAEAARAARRAAAAREAEVERLSGLQQAWSRSLAAPPIDLDLARAWVGAVVLGEAALKARGREADAADTARTGAGEALVAALAREAAADAVGRSAQRRLALRRDEASLAESDDRTARGWLRRSVGR
jgi:hypothetical protein